MAISKEIVLTERLRRQRLLEPVNTHEDYAALFELLQPVSPIADSCPGDPPTLVHRGTLNDYEINSNLRQNREIVKGRFLRGTIGYVFSKDLELYANAFQRPIERLNRNQELIYNTLLHTGPLTPRQIKDETGLLNKEIMPILHRLQEAFLVYEDQLDNDWERAWYIFSQEWMDINVEQDRWEAAAQEVLCRFLHSYVFASFKQIKDWSGWSVKEIKYLLQRLEEKEIITTCIIDGLGDGWMHTEDTSIDCNESPHSVFMLHKSDPLVRAESSELKRRFTVLEVLQYLFIDGDFQGAVCGHWRIGPHDVDNIVLNMPAEKCKATKDEIIEAVAWKYHPPSHHIIRYNGKPISGW